MSGGSSLYEGQKVSRDDEEKDYYPPSNIFPEELLGYGDMDVSTSHDSNAVDGQADPESESNPTE